jgi:lipoprotein-anchoring transpeptidase ErfK/SrfK
VWVDRAPLFRKTGDGIDEVGYAEIHARIYVTAEVGIGDEEYVVSEDGFALRRSDVRVVREVPRPENVDPGERWIHIDLAEQSLTAYDENDVPIYATLISSGKPGYDTPTGRYFVGAKHVTTTMSGDDPNEGHYEVEEVPWTMYYLDSYAIHGAYWHDQFGRTRSPGCTNVAPADARWLFRWSRPHVPGGWQARIGKGTRVAFTR